MKDKNKKLIMLIGVILVGIGVSFAYFTSKLLGGGVGGNIDVTTAVINGSTLKVEGTLSFDDENILPGHKNISSIKVTAKGNNEIIPYNLIWNGINNLGTPLNFTVYKTNNKITTNINCIKETGVQDGKQTLNEKCTLTNEENLGEVLATGTIEQNENETKTILVKDEVITSSESGTEVYYYVILEYPNLNENQNADIGACFEGIVTIEKSEIKADVNILAVNISEDGENYTQTQDIPQTGYTLNTSKSTCTNGGVANWENNRFYIDNLIKSGTSCTLYFDKTLGKPMREIIASLNPKTGTNEFTGAVITVSDSGLFSTEDDDGITYYYHGVLNDTSTNNWVDFAGFKWRIIRINGDGSIRLIYNGTDYSQTGEETQIKNAKFNLNDKDNAYVGYMYGEINSNSYANTHKNETSSNIKIVLDNWYKENILDKNFAKYVSTETGFCGDRTVQTITDFSGNGTTTNKTSYAPLARLANGISDWKTTQKPTYNCNTNDLYTLSTSSKGNKALQYPVGLITSDEAIYAGGFVGIQNKQYWLYTSKGYWTISPKYFWSNAVVINVNANGDISYNNYVNSALGVRPVINLSKDVEITGSGTTTDPLRIVGA